MRAEKIRGHRRRQRRIENWRLENLNFNLERLKKYKREYVEIIVHPWCDISLIKSKIPPPKRRTKQITLSGLLDIYESWKVQLDKLGQPYYLKIWLFEPRFSESQVVCAIGEKIEYYETNFFKPTQSKVLKHENYGELNRRLEEYNWDYRLDEFHYDNGEVGNPEQYSTPKDYEETKKWFANLLKKSHRTEIFEEPIGDRVEGYSWKQGDLWIGGKK
ncbi:MAG TPA: hypothetical protein VGC65_04310 [Bacteroidia bacterium]|jgi:hypothetical protein